MSTGDQEEEKRPGSSLSLLCPDVTECWLSFAQPTICNGPLLENKIIRFVLWSCCCQALHGLKQPYAWQGLLTTSLSSCLSGLNMKQGKGWEAKQANHMVSQAGKKRSQSACDFKRNNRGPWSVSYWRVFQHFWVVSLWTMCPLVESRLTVVSLDSH